MASSYHLIRDKSPVPVSYEEYSSIVSFFVKTTAQLWQSTIHELKNLTTTVQHVYEQFHTNRMKITLHSITSAAFTKIVLRPAI